MLSLRHAAGLAFVVLAGAGVADAAQPAHCLGGLVPVLTAGNFSGSVDCGRDKLTVRYVGVIKTSKHHFAIYDYRYRLAPPCRDCSPHGGQRVIFLQDGRYAGQYKPDAVELKVEGTTLVVIPAGRLDPKSSKRKPSEFQKPEAMSVTDDGPPEEFRVGGESLSFFR
jgi:hypothetical protein